MTPLTVSFGSAETGTGAPIQSNSSDVWAAITLDGTGLQVSFESSGKNYPVSGCYADYTALLAANIGPDAYVFALTAGGFVEAVNMTACSRFETFCSMGPLYGLSGITSLEAGNGTAYAVDAEGGKHDLLPLVQSVESGFSAILSGTWEANRRVTHFASASARTGPARWRKRGRAAALPRPARLPCSAWETAASSAPAL